VLFGPRASARTPTDVIAKLNVATLPTISASTTYSGDFRATSRRRAMQRAEIEKWWPIINAAGIKAEWPASSAWSGRMQLTKERRPSLGGTGAVRAEAEFYCRAPAKASWFESDLAGSHDPLPG
jgi:hypothetical protein